MDDNKIYGILKSTGMSDHDAKNHMKNGVSIYEDTDAARKEFFDQCIACLCPEEDVPECGKNLKKHFSKVFATELISFCKMKKATISCLFPHK